MNRVTRDLPDSIDLRLQDFAQATGLIDYTDIVKLGHAWDRLAKKSQDGIRDAIYAALDVRDDDPDHKALYDNLARLVKSAGLENNNGRNIKMDKNKNENKSDASMGGTAVTCFPDDRKTIIITAGPTNERIDAVMKITNMSTGSTGARIAEALLGGQDGYSCHAENIKKIYYVAQKLARRPVVPDGQAYKIHDIQVESTEDLLNTLRCLLSNPDEHIDAVVQSAAVGDYKGRFALRAEDLAREICDRNEQDGTLNYDEILSIITCPACLQDDDTKMSSYEPNLMVMLDLTPKVITEIKKWSPGTLLVGFKLLENVDEDTLLAAARKVQNASRAEFVLANDLAKIKSGSHDALLVGPDGSVVKRMSGKDQIADELSFAVMEGTGRYRFESSGGTDSED